MRTPHWTFAWTLAAATGLALPALAGPKGQPAAHGHPPAAAHAAPAAKGHEKADEAAKAKGHEGDHASAKGQEAREAAGDNGKAKGKDKDKDEADNGHHKGPPEAVQKKLEQLRATRKQRRAAHLARIKQRWGKAVAHPAVRAELKVHAWRMARLDRIKELASANDKKDVVARVDKLIEKENARHDKHMGVLKTKGARQ